MSDTHGTTNHMALFVNWVTYECVRARSRVSVTWIVLLPNNSTQKRDSYSICWPVSSFIYSLCLFTACVYFTACLFTACVYLQLVCLQLVFICWPSLCLFTACLFTACVCLQLVFVYSLCLFTACICLQPAFICWPVSSLFTACICLQPAEDLATAVNKHKL